MECLGEALNNNNSCEWIDSTLKKINDDIIASDFLWSIFVAAMQSYRYDTVLRPFPNYLLKNGVERDFEHLRFLTSKIQNFKELLQLDRNYLTLHSDSLKLLSWVLDTRNFILKSHSACKFADIRRLTGHIIDIPTPNYIVEVLYDPSMENRFTSIRKQLPLLYAYHGSRLDNFHSILHSGLHNHLNKNSVFGTGTYLSSELSVSMTYSSTGQGWTNSLMGQMLSCVAVCEMIDHPNIKSQVKDRQRQNYRWMSTESVPEKYFIVQNDELVRVKFILIYAEKPAHRPRFFSISRWVTSHSFGLMMLIYIMVLLYIGLLNSKNLRLFFKNKLT